MSDYLRIDGISLREFFESINANRANNTYAWLESSDNKSEKLAAVLDIAKRYGADRIRFLGSGKEALAFEIRNDNESAVIRLEENGRPVQRLPKGILPPYEDKVVRLHGESIRVSVAPYYKLLENSGLSRSQQRDVSESLTTLLAQQGYYAPEAGSYENIGVYRTSSGATVAGLFDAGRSGQYFFEPPDIREADLDDRKLVEEKARRALLSDWVEIWNDSADDVRRDIAQRGQRWRAEGRTKRYQTPIFDLDGQALDHNSRGNRKARGGHRDQPDNNEENSRKNPKEQKPSGNPRRPKREESIDMSSILDIFSATGIEVENVGEAINQIFNNGLPHRLFNAANRSPT